MIARDKISASMIDHETCILPAFFKNNRLDIIDTIE